MKNWIKIASVSSLIVCFGAGCASTDKKVEQQLKEEKITTSQELMNEAENIIEQTPGLSIDQKQKLTALRLETKSKLKELYEEGIKLRSILIQNVFAQNQMFSEIQAIKGRIKKIENKKLDVIYKAVDRAYTILGKQAVDNHLLMNEMIMNRRGVF